MARASIAQVSRDKRTLTIGNIESVTKDMLRVYTADTAIGVRQELQNKGQFPSRLTRKGDTTQRGYIKIVDRRHGADEYNVRPGGRIMYQANTHTMTEVVAWIGEQLVRNSPYRDKRSVDKGWRATHYQDTHLFMIDGKSVFTIDNISQIVTFKKNFQLDKHVTSKKSKYQFVNLAVYARRIENGGRTSNGLKKPWSSQAPSGVYKAVARAAKIRFGQTVRIYYRELQLNTGVVIAKGSKKAFNQFYPTIIVTARDTTLGVS